MSHALLRGDLSRLVRRLRSASIQRKRTALPRVKVEGHLRLPDQGIDPEDEERLKEPRRSEMMPLVRYFFVTRARFSAGPDQHPTTAIDPTRKKIGRTEFPIVPA